MVLNNIELLNFRLHKNTSLKFSDNLNFIIGGNGQGKTSILEAIYYLCTTKNLNNYSDGEAVTFDTKGFEINGVFKELTSNKTRLIYDSDSNKKNYFVDEKQVHKAYSIIGQFPVVTLIQSDHAITQGSPSDRRKFVDSVISQASVTYLKTLLDYNRTLRQRSSLLSQIKETGDKNLYDHLDAWNSTLVTTGTEIIKHRLKFIKEFNQYVKDAYKNIMQDKEQPLIEYLPFNTNNEDSVEKLFVDKLKERKEEELRRGVNLIGPHREDFVFRINNLELKKYGSQGQHKTFQIALRFAQFFYMKEKLNKTPIFLMDDVFGELDSFRANKISGYLKEIGQAFITMTDFSKIDELNISDSDLLIKIKEGDAEYA
jgi:DNA replication and repair protein RecF